MSQLVRLESGPRHTPDEALALTVADAVTASDSAAAPDADADTGSGSSLMSGLGIVSPKLCRLEHEPVLERMRPNSGAGEWLKFAAPLIPFALTVSVRLAGLKPTLSELCRAPTAGEFAPLCVIC